MEYAYFICIPRKALAIVVWECDVSGAEIERTSQCGEITIQAAV
jgi:hypothetical protein